MPHISASFGLPAERVYADHQGLLPAAHLTSNAAGPVHHLSIAVCKLLQVSIMLCAPPLVLLRSCKLCSLQAIILETQAQKTKEDSIEGHCYLSCRDDQAKSSQV